MQRVLDAPMAAYRVLQLFCWGRQTADVVAGLTGAARCGFSMANHFDGRFQLGPLPLGVDVVQTVCRGNYPAFPPFHPSVSFVHGLGVVIGRPVKVRCCGLLEQVSDALVELTLILFHRQHVIGPAVHNLLGNLPLTSHGVNGDDTTMPVQQVQQLGNGGDFIGLRRGFDLAQGQSLPPRRRGYRVMGCRPAVPGKFETTPVCSCRRVPPGPRNRPRR